MNNQSRRAFFKTAGAAVVSTAVLDGLKGTAAIGGTASEAKQAPSI